MNEFERMILDSNSLLNRIARGIIAFVVIVTFILVVAKFITGAW